MAERPPPRRLLHGATQGLPGLARGGPPPQGIVQALRCIPWQLTPCKPACKEGHNQGRSTPAGGLSLRHLHLV